MTRPNFFRALFAVLSVLLMVAAISRLGAEMRVVSSAGRAPASVLISFTFSAPELAAAGSTVAQVRQMTECDDILASSLATISSVRATNNLATTCAQRAKQILDGTPTLAVAHLALSRALHQMGRTKEAEASLLAAAQTAASEGWLSARRLRLFADIGVTENLQVQQSIQRDAMTVLGDSRYLPLLAEIYARSPDLQGWLRFALQNGSAEDLSRFVRLTKKRLLVNGETQ